MAVDLLARCGGREREGVERVVDARGVEGGVGRRWGGRGVELGEVEPARLFRGGFAVFWGGAGGCFFRGEEGVFFGFFAREVGFFLVFGFSVGRRGLGRVEGER